MLSCAEADKPKIEASHAADASKGKPATQDLKSALIGTWAFSNGISIEYTIDGKEIISVWYIANSTYTWIDDTHFEEKGRNGVTMIWDVKLDGDTLTLVGEDLSVHLTRVKSS